MPASESVDGHNEFKLTYANLRAMLNAAHWARDHGMRTVAVDVQAGEGDAAALVPDGSVTIHDHPDTTTPLEIHFMVDAHDGNGPQKIAVLGPPLGKGPNAGLTGGYVYFLGEWMGRPVAHQDWKNRIMADNNLMPEYQGIDELAGQVILLTAELWPAETMMDPRVRMALKTAANLAWAIIGTGKHESYTDAVLALDARERS